MHGLPEWTQISIFYNSVNTPTRMMLDASTNGTLLDKPPKKAWKSWTSSHRMITSTPPLEGEVQGDLTNMVKNMQKQPHIQEVKALDAFYEQCGNNHDASECGWQIESSCYVGNYNKNVMSNTYNPAWRNHPNFSWKKQNNTVNPQQQTRQDFKTSRGRINNLCQGRTINSPQTTRTWRIL
ncbi:hypothetical protein GQ457_13G016480 [Hibiscus cannabinus]